MPVTASQLIAQGWKQRSPTSSNWISPDGTIWGSLPTDIGLANVAANPFTPSSIAQAAANIVGSAAVAAQVPVIIPPASAIPPIQSPSFSAAATSSTSAQDGVQNTASGIPMIDYLTTLANQYGFHIPNYLKKAAEVGLAVAGVGVAAYGVHRILKSRGRLQRHSRRTSRSRARRRH